MKIVHIFKNLKQRLPSLKFYIRLGLQLAVIGLLYVHGGSFSAVVGVFIGYKLVGLIFRLIGLLMTAVIIFISIIVLFLIISLLIF